MREKNVYVVENIFLIFATAHSISSLHNISISNGDAVTIIIYIIVTATTTEFIHIVQLSVLY